MRKQEFIDAVYAAGWRPSLDAQHSEIAKVWAQCFPTAAALEEEIADLIADLIETAHYAGQVSAGVDPSYSLAKEFLREIGRA